MISSPSIGSPAIATTLPIVETFHSIQGEGVWTGTNAFFIRLGGCDVGCSWCDTKQSWNSKRHSHRDLPELVALVQAANPAIVVITGGEPLLHDLAPLTTALHQAGQRLHLETSGAHPFSGQFDWVTLSPKPWKPPHESVYPQVNELKVIVSSAADLTWAEQQADRVPTSAVRSLQPEWHSPDSQAIVFEYVLQHPNWRISLQTHKLLGVQ